MCDELRQSFTLLPPRSEARIWISKPSESRINKFICRRRASTCPLSVEGPAENELSRTVMVISHPTEPMVKEGGFPGTAPGNDCNVVDILACPSTIQKCDILLSTNNIAPCNGQSGY